MSRRRVSLSGSSCWYLVEQKPLQVQKERSEKKERTGTALTAESDRCTATHRAKRSSGTASCRRLFKSLFILGGIYQGSACVNTYKLYRFLLACHSHVPPPEHTCPQLNRNKTKNTSSRRAGCCCARRGS